MTVTTDLPTPERALAIAAHPDDIERPTATTRSARWIVVRARTLRSSTSIEPVSSSPSRSGSVSATTIRYDLTRLSRVATTAR